jgi:hypothetical protein
MVDSVFHFAPSPPDFERWLTVARRAALGGYTRDAILGGLRARLLTDNLPLAEAWSEIFFGPQDWRDLVRQTAPLQPAMSLYAAAVQDYEPVIAVSPTQSAAVMINRTESDALLDALIALAAQKLGEQIGWVARGTCVAVGQRGVLVAGPGHAEVATQIASQANGQIAVSDPVLVRITLTRQVDGVQLAPTRILTERGQEITGARILRWLRRDAYQEPRADVFCLTLAQRDEPVMARDLDLDRCAELYAYPLTRTGRKLAAPPRVTDAIALLPDSRAAMFSLYAKTFVARLALEQPWIPQEVVQEVALALECHAAGATSLADQQLQLFIAEIVKRMKAKG